MGLMAVIDSQPSSGIVNSASLVRSLLALPELPMRILWLEDRIYLRPISATAPVLNHIAEQAQSTDKRAREAMVAIAIFLAQRKDTSLIWALREEARAQSLLGLERLVREPHESHVPEIEIEPRVPDYGTGRELSLGERRALARRPTRLQIERLLLDPHPLVLEQLYQCPTITEDDILRIVTKRPAHVAALELLASHARWMARPRIRLGLILNPGTPHGLALPLITTCPRDDLNLIVGTTNLNKALRTVALELHSRLPPVREDVVHPQHH
jgi:hypothetical protein